MNRDYSCPRCDDQVTYPDPTPIGGYLCQRCLNEWFTANGVPRLVEGVPVTRYPPLGKAKKL